MKKKENKTAKRIANSWGLQVRRVEVPRIWGPGIVALCVAFLLAGCGGGSGGSGGSSTSTASTTAWPSATPPATSQTNTYIGTQSPGLYTVTIDHTNNTFSYQDLSASSAAVTGTFTAAPNGFLILSTSTGATDYALEQLSRAVVLFLYQTGNRTPTSDPVFAVSSSACQVIPSKTEFEYVASAANPNFDVFDPLSAVVTEERTIGSGQIFASTDAGGANWQFGGEVQYELPTSTSSSPDSYVPVPEPFSATCAPGSAGTSLVQTVLTVPTSTPANFIIGPTGYFIEDRYQSDGVAFYGAVRPSSPVDLSQLNGVPLPGVQFLGIGSFSAATDSSGTSITLTGGTFPNNDPTQAPVANQTYDLGAQDPLNNGYFPSATQTTCNQTLTNGVCNGSYTVRPVFALVTNAGGKYTIFLSTGWFSFSSNGSSAVRALRQ